MSVDPYHAVQHDIQTSLQAAVQLRASYVRIRNMARDDSEELSWAQDELKATLATLEADLEDLEASVKVVESADARTFGLDDAEVQNRRRYVIHVRREIESMRAELSSPATNTITPSTAAQPSGSRTTSRPTTPRNKSVRFGPTSAHSPDEDDDQRAWAREEQQMIMREQDQTIDSIAGTLNTLAQQASLMGQEIGEHHELLEDLERGVDKTDTNLSSAMRKMRKLLRETEERGSGWCIVILIIVLIMLLLAVILV